MPRREGAAFTSPSLCDLFGGNHPSPLGCAVLYEVELDRGLPWADAAQMLEVQQELAARPGGAAGLSSPVGAAATKAVLASMPAPEEEDADAEQQQQQQQQQQPSSGALPAGEQQQDRSKLKASGTLEQPGGAAAKQQRKRGRQGLAGPGGFAPGLPAAAADGDSGGGGGRGKRGRTASGFEAAASDGDQQLREEEDADMVQKGEEQQQQQPAQEEQGEGGGEQRQQRASPPPPEQHQQQHQQQQVKVEQEPQAGGSVVDLTLSSGSEDEGATPAQAKPSSSKEATAAGKASGGGGAQHKWDSGFYRAKQSGFSKQVGLGLSQRASLLCGAVLWLWGACGRLCVTRACAGRGVERAPLGPCEDVRPPPQTIHSSSLQISHPYHQVHVLLALRVEGSQPPTFAIHRPATGRARSSMSLQVRAGRLGALRRASCWLADSIWACASCDLHSIVQTCARCSSSRDALLACWHAVVEQPRLKSPPLPPLWPPCCRPQDLKARYAPLHPSACQPIWEAAWEAAGGGGKEGERRPAVVRKKRIHIIGGAVLHSWGVVQVRGQEGRPAGGGGCGWVGAAGEGGTLQHEELWSALLRNSHAFSESPASQSST